MRVLIVSTSEAAGGAAVAASRLCDALNNNGVKARMLVRDKQSDDITVATAPQSWLSQLGGLWERWCIFVRLAFQKKHLWEVDTAQAGIDITRTREFREADVVHLHWVNQGMLSLQGLRRVLDSGKPVVWTMHDMWPATAICHLTLQCRNFKTGCRRCRLLPGGGGDHDLAARTWARKQDVMRGRDITFVACSRWLQGEAKASALLKGQRVLTIPNPIDTHTFAPGSQREAREHLQLPHDKRLLLFAAQRATNSLKGIDYLADALRELDADTELIVVGGHAEEVAHMFGQTIHALGYIASPRQMAEVYRAADAFVLPSLSENLPNTIMEAMACGTPCVGFRVGGIPEMIDHLKTGYVAAYRDAHDLARGLRYVLCEADRKAMADAAVARVAHNYSQRAVAMHYLEVYNEALASKHYRL